MSRLGKSAIVVPKGVEVKSSKDQTVNVHGPRGVLTLQLPLGLSIKIDGQTVLVERDEAIMPNSALHGLFRSLLKNHIQGVHAGFEIRLVMIGVGYRANAQGDVLDLSIGNSHPTTIKIPKSIQVTIEKGTLVIIKGNDKREIGQFAATVRSMKPPEPYKGKGIRYENEYVRKKAGKAAKGKSAP
ncbi:MAG TPA: 50S ribosomal protein L6 [Chlamydiales bacterium]|nr:50S ribosomal protein L6 [Chlamydiales bacterium]